jgi:hypothetical protein
MSHLLLKRLQSNLLQLRTPKLHLLLPFPMMEMTSTMFLNLWNERRLNGLWRML